MNRLAAQACTAGVGKHPMTCRCGCGDLNWRPSSLRFSALIHRVTRCLHFLNLYLLIAYTILPIFVIVSVVEFQRSITIFKTKVYICLTFSKTRSNEVHHRWEKRLLNWMTTAHMCVRVSACQSLSKEKLGKAPCIIPASALMREHSNSLALVLSESQVWPLLLAGRLLLS